MQDREQHISDEDLLLAAEDELGRRATRVRAHVEGCMYCRTRAAQFENVLGDLARAEKRSLDPELPSIAGPRARLRARLAELPVPKTSFFTGFRIFRDFSFVALGMTALAAGMVAASVLIFQHSTTPTTALSFLPDRAVLPNRAFTPGAARPVSLEQVCSLSHEEVIKPVSAAERERVFAEYGISAAQAGQYEVDYLITPGLGGDDDIRNLWPEPYRPGKWNAYVKDALEERLHELVCSRQLDLSVAQQAIATDWIAAYRKYVQPAASKMQIDRTTDFAATVRSIAPANGSGTASLFANIVPRKPRIQKSLDRAMTRLAGVSGMPRFDVRA